jgi:hypothetical protein
MKCLHLIKWLTFACKAKENLYFPSCFQLDEYCKTKDHKKCPFFRNMSTGREIDRLVSASR